MGKNYITISLFTILIFLATILAAVITNANSAEFNDSKTEKVVRLNDYWFQLNRKSKI